MEFEDYNIVFNAKRLSDESLVEQFIVPSAYPKAIGQHHSIMIGPRGSGKTTILRMMQPSTIKLYNLATEIKDNVSIGFTGVFVGIDNKYYDQIQSKAAAIESDSAKVRLSTVAYGCQIYTAIIRYIYSEVSGQSSPTGIGVSNYLWNIKVEKEFVQAVASAFFLPNSIYSVRGLIEAFRARSSEISRFYNQLRHSLIDEKDLPLWVDDEVISKVIELTGLYNDISECPERQWALLLDELELAPAIVRNSFIHAMRGADHNLIIKMAVSPTDLDSHQYLDSNLPMEGNDYVLIDLHESDEKERQEFCRNLWGKIRLKSKILESTSLADLLGGSLLSDPYDKMIANKKDLKKDKPLFLYLEDKIRDFSVKLETGAFSEKEKDNYLRKLAVIFVYRKEMLNNSNSSKRRPRKTFAQIYTGEETLISLSEANPRWFILFAQELLANIIDSSTYIETRKGTIRMKQEVQARIIDVICRRIAYRFQYNPRYRTLTTSSHRTLDLVEHISKRINEMLLSDYITTDIVNRFYLTKKSSSFSDLVNIGLHSGSMVLTPSRKSKHPKGDMLHTVFGKDLRIAYILAPIYGLPIRLGKSRSLDFYIQDHNSIKPFDLKLFSDGN